MINAAITAVTAVQLATVPISKPLKLERFAHSPNHQPFTGIQVGEFVVQMQRKESGRGYRSKTRVYGACNDLIADINALEPTFISSTDENSTDAERVQEKMWLAWRDNGKKVAQARLTEILTAVAKANLPLWGLTPEAIEGIKFSFKAGCSMCPCSPGFILGECVEFEGWMPVDIWIVPAAKLERRTK
jgi:hypothetical protein